MIDTDRFEELVKQQNWTSLYAMLDEARSKAVSREDVRSEVHWRIAALKRQKRYEEALSLLRNNASVYDSQSLVRHRSSQLLVQLGREREALEEISKAPFEAELTSHYGLALDAKFYCFLLKARAGDASIASRLSEFPQNFEYVEPTGRFLTVKDILGELTGIDQK